MHARATGTGIILGTPPPVSVMDANTSADAEEFFQDAKTMTVSEVAIALEHYTNERRTRDPSYQPNLLVSKTRASLDLVSTFLRFYDSMPLRFYVSVSCPSARHRPIVAVEGAERAKNCSTPPVSRFHR